MIEYKGEIKKMKKLRLIKVPTHSKNHFINNVGCLRYEVMEGSVIVSSVVEPDQIGFYLEKDKHKIVGYTELYGNKFIVIENIS